MYWYLKVLKQYADFKGRARRKEYWMFFLFNVIVAFSFGFVCGLIGMPDLNIVYTLAVLLPSIAVLVRRAHDVGKSGWVMIIPIYNLVIALKEGEKQENKYGPDPKGLDTEISV